VCARFEATNDVLDDVEPGFMKRWGHHVRATPNDNCAEPSLPSMSSRIAGTPGKSSRYDQIEPLEH
jgi:hypothetical protein